MIVWHRLETDDKTGARFVVARFADMVWRFPVLRSGGPDGEVAYRHTYKGEIHYGGPEAWCVISTAAVDGQREGVQR